MNRTRNIILIVSLVVVTATTAFIFSNSMQDTADSWDKSNIVAALLEPILRRLYNHAGSWFEWATTTGVITYGVFVRKLAHFTEYFILGAECALVTTILTRRIATPHLWGCLFVPLAVAVLDEFAQSFFDRTSQVADVLLDFAGACSGIIVVLIIAAIVLSIGRGLRAKGS